MHLIVLSVGSFLITVSCIFSIMCMLFEVQN